MPKKVKSRLNKRRVEDSLLVMLQGGKAVETDVDFGQADIKFNNIAMYERGRKFQKFTSSGIKFEQAGFDEKNRVISYLFHKV
jgi:hypothetical protein